MYSKEEKARRLAAAAALIKAEGLQAIFLQGNGTVGGNSLGNYRYFVDNRTNFFIACAVITPEGQLLGVVSSVMARNHLVKDSFVDNAIISPDRLGGVIKYLKENGMDKGRLGVLLEVLPASWLLRLRKELPELQLVDVSDALFSIRTQRSAEETETLRRCGRIADEGCKAFEKAAVPGAMEHEVVADTIAAMQRCGCDNFFMLIASGRFSAEGSKMTTLHNAGGIDRRLEDGDTVSMEITPYFNGNWTQLVRTVSVGRPNPDADEFIRVTKLGISAAAALIKPGVSISELVKAMRAAVEAEGYRLAMPCGHICGADLNEERLSEDNERLLLPGMCVIIHPTVLKGGLKSGIYWGESYLVTKNGCECLMPESAKD